MIKNLISIFTEGVGKVHYIALIIILLLVAGGSCMYRMMPNLEQDNFAEEAIEEIIEGHTGWEIDLSPDSEEEHCH